MKIEFSRSGGFAGRAMRQNLEIDSDDLPPEQAAELHELINKADIAASSGRTSPPAPDAFHYRITVSDGGVAHTATASDADMPDSMGPLVDWLTERALQKS